VAVHPAPVVAKQGLGHKGSRFPKIESRIFYYVFEQHYIIGSAQESRESKVYFALPARCDFVVVHLRLYADLLKIEHNVGAQVVERI
jgi:hypothetical protein